MLQNLNVPNLETIGGSLSLLGQKNVNQDNFPKLKKVGGDLHLALSGFTQLPNSLEFVGGNIFLTQEPESLVTSCLKKKKDGIIKGSIFLVGGKISTGQDGKIDYAEKVLIG